MCWSVASSHLLKYLTDCKTPYKRRIARRIGQKDVTKSNKYEMPGITIGKLKEMLHHDVYDLISDTSWEFYDIKNQTNPEKLWLLEQASP